MVDQKTKLVLLCSDNPTTWIIYNRLVQEFGPFPVLIEPHVSRQALLRNRMRKLGLLAALSQVAFVIIIRPLLNFAGKPRIAKICRQQGLERTRPMSSHIIPIDSVNGAACEAFLREAKADVIIVNGTRIIRPRILAATGAPFINIHQGITPQYRGAHGAYWALLHNDDAHCGVTVHLVDEGIDTGGIIAQAIIEPKPADSFVTYAYLQTAAALPLLLAAIKNTLAGSLETQTHQGPSRLWYHPGFFGYIFGRLRGVR